jgi:8-amino-7-oxononanoate synthase
MSDALAWLADAAEDRARRGVHRTLSPRPAGADVLLDLASNDYLGLSRHTSVIDASVAAVRAYGAGSTGSRLVTGSTELHAQLESALAEFLGAETALVFSSGYLANLGGIGSLAGPGSLIVSDAGNHASLIDACRLSGARVVVAPSGDLAAVEAALADRAEDRAMVVTDAVFSVTGRAAPVAALHGLTRRYGAALFVDEAHAVGVVGSGGAGVCAQAGIADQPDVVLTVTLSKSLGAQGGAVLGSAAVQRQLIDTARPFIFDTGLAPACAGAALAALALVTPERVARLRSVCDALADGLEVPATDGAVLSVVLGDPSAATLARDLCEEDGVRVGCFRPPSVPAGGACLRLAGQADLAPDDVSRAAAVVRAAVARAR